MFQLPDVTACTCTNANPRTEHHGDELHRAIDLTFTVTGENTLLDAIAPGLRAHHFRNAAADASQESLPDVAVPLPNLRFAQLPTDNIRWNLVKARGYRWIWDWGREAQHVDFSDAALASLSYTLHEGGSVDVKFTVSYNGDELGDNTLFGELCGLSAMGEVHIQLLAPATLLPVKKGWRSGKPDTPQTDGGGELFDQEHAGEEEHEEHPEGDGFAEGSPEAALLDSVQPEPEPEPDPFQAPPKARRGRKAAAGAALQ